MAPSAPTATRPSPSATSPDYPAHLEVDYPERLSRGLVLVKWWLLAIPHYLIVGLLLGGAGYYIGNADDSSRLVATGLIPLLAVVAGVVLLLTGRYPQPLFDLLLGLNRWVLRVAGYAALMTDTYPPFRLDQGGHEGGSGTLSVTSPPAPAPAPSPSPSPSASSTGTPPPRPTASRWTTGRVVSLVVGCVLALVSLGLAVPGFALLVADQTVRDQDGFLMSPEQTFQTSTYAIISGDQQLQVDAPSDLTPAALLGDMKLTATATDGTAVFVGVGPAADVETYLAGVQHATLVELRDGEAVYRTTAGGAPPNPPQAGDFWVAQASGPGTQELTWTPANGDWVVLTMNADASRGVDVAVTAGAEIPALPWVIAVLLSLAGLSLVRCGGPHRGAAADRLARRRRPAMTWLIAAFLIAHGAVHLAIWLPPAAHGRRAPGALRP